MRRNGASCQPCAPYARLVRFLVVLLAMAAGASVLGEPLRHNYDLKNVLWKLSFDFHKGTIVGDATNTLTLSSDTPNVQLHCADLTVNRVLVNGQTAQFDTNDNKLTVALPSPGKAGDTLNIETYYSGKPTNGMYFVADSRAFPSKTGMIYTQGEGEDNHYWLPTYDYPDDKATTECYVTVPLNWVAISNGKLMDVQEVSGEKVFHWKMDQPYSTYLISLVAGRYEEFKDQWHGIPVSYWVPPGLEEEGKASFSATPKMIDLYSKLTGVDYPYAKFTQDVVADFVAGGMENVTCVTQEIQTLHLPSSEPVADSTYLVAHELAHHWFGDLITCETWEHVWLNEGFATTLPMFYDRSTVGEDTFDLDRYKNFELAINSIGSRNRGAVAGKTGDAQQVTMGSVYDGGCSRIMMLYHLLGEDTFWKGIHDFLEKYKFQCATTDEFFDTVGSSAGTDLHSFMRQWYHTAATPSLTVDVSDGNLVLTQLSPYYSLDLPVWILDGDDWVKKSVHIDGPEGKLELGDLSLKPLLVDPECWSLMELKYKNAYTPQDVYELYRHAPNAAEKARIVDEFFPALPVKQRVAIGHGETFHGLIEKIAGTMNEEGEGFLLELTHNQDERVVNAAVTRLDSLKPSDICSARLEQVAASDPNEIVREHATKALMDWKNDPAYATKVYGMKAFDDGYRRMALAWYGDHAPEQARQKALEVLEYPDSEPLRETAIQVLGKVKERPGETAVFDALIKVAQENSYWSRIAAINALAGLGNRDAVPVLRPLILHSPGGVRGAAQAAVDALSR